MKSRLIRPVDQEMNPVAGAVRQHGVEVTAVHNHGLFDTPRLFCMHFWATDDPAKLAQGLKAALGLTNNRLDRKGDLE